MIGKFDAAGAVIFNWDVLTGRLTGVLFSIYRRLFFGFVSHFFLLLFTSIIKEQEVGRMTDGRVLIRSAYQSMVNSSPQIKYPLTLNNYDHITINT